MKHLFRSLTRAHRAYKDTRNHALTLLHRASAAVLTAVLVYKALTYLLFLPAMNGIWSLTLRCSPVNYLTNNNAHQIFTSPTILGGIVLIVLLAAFWNLYGFSILLHGFALARRGETLRPVSLFVRSLGDIRHVLLPKNWPILLYCALLIPFTDVFVTYNYISQLAVPEYILGLVRAKPLYLVLFLLILSAAFLFTLFWVLVLPLFTLERKSLWEAVQESAAHVKTQLPRLAGVLLRWNLSALVRSVLVFFGASLLVYSVAALIGLRSTRACRSGCPVNTDSVLAQTLVLSGQAEGAQGLEGGHDNIDVVDDRAACGEHAGDVVEQLANIQEHVPSGSLSGCATLQVHHFVLIDRSKASGHFDLIVHHNGDSSLSNQSILTVCTKPSTPAPEPDRGSSDRNGQGHEFRIPSGIVPIYRLYDKYSDLSIEFPEFLPF